MTGRHDRLQRAGKSAEKELTVSESELQAGQQSAERTTDGELAQRRACRG